MGSFPATVSPPAMTANLSWKRVRVWCILEPAPPKESPVSTVVASFDSGSSMSTSFSE